MSHKFCCLTTRRFLPAFSAIAVAVTAGQAVAVDGTRVNAMAVSEVTRSGDYNWQPMAAEGVIGQFTNWGKLVKFRIVGGKSVGCDTIFHGLASHPSFTFDGQRIAFYRLSATVNYSVNPPRGQLVGSLDDSGWIAVCDTNGQNLRNLVKVPRTALNNCSAIDQGPKVHCPSGSWIYYEKTPMTGEVWKINYCAPDPASTNQLVVKLGSATSWNCSNIGPWGFRRWSINKAATLSAGQIFGQNSDNPICTFPWTNGSISQSMIKSIPGCNGSISAGGRYWCGYNGNHYMAGFGTIIPDAGQPRGYRYSEDVNDFGVPGLSTRVFSLGDLATWAGESRELKWGNHMRWSCNSEKWLLWAGLHYYGTAGMYESGGMDQAAMNWVDHAGIHISHNKYFDNCITNNTWDWNCTGPGISNMAGDMFVFGGPANSYEKVDGTWQYVEPLAGSLNCPTVAVDMSRSTATAALRLSVAIDAGGAIVVRHDNARAGILEIVDLHARVVERRPIAGDATTIPAGVLSQGTYLIRMSGWNRTTPVRMTVL